MRALPVKTVAALTAGLRDSSRIKQKIRKEKLPLDTFLLAVLIDRITDLGTGLKIYDKAPSVVELLTGTEKQSRVTAFATPEEWKRKFEKMSGK